MNKILNKNFKIEAVFFDLDGTFFDTSHDLLLALNYLLEKYGYPTVSLDALIPFISGGSKEVLKTIINQDIPEDILENYKIEYIKTYHKLGHKHTDFFPGIEKTVELLNSKQIPWGIITNKTEVLTLPMIELFDLYNKYSCSTVVCADTTSKAKPHPEPMLKACNDLKVVPKNCVFIGDAITDIQAGQSVNMTTILAAYGYIPKDTIKDIKTWGANLIVHSPLELLEIF